jgi:hypothetical protein
MTELWGVAEGFLVAFQRRFHMIFVARVSHQSSSSVIRPFALSTRNRGTLKAE